MGNWSCLSWWSNFLRTKAEDNISAISWGRKYKQTLGHWVWDFHGFPCGCATDSWKNLAVASVTFRFVQATLAMFWSSRHPSADRGGRSITKDQPWPQGPKAPRQPQTQKNQRLDPLWSQPFTGRFKKRLASLRSSEPMGRFPFAGWESRAGEFSKINWQSKRNIMNQYVPLVLKLPALRTR